MAASLLSTDYKQKNKERSEKKQSKLIENVENVLGWTYPIDGEVQPDPHNREQEKNKIEPNQQGRLLHETRCIKIISDLLTSHQHTHKKEQNQKHKIKKKG